MKRLVATIAAVVIVLGGMLMCFGCETADKYKVNYYDATTPQFYADGDAVFGVGANNNGVDKYGESVDKMTAVKPNSQQLDFLELEYYNFIHYGMNTYTGKEWGTGEEDPAKFNPSDLDTDQWVRTLKASGSKGIIFTAKHHDGFCLWQTETTEHSIKNSPYKDGKGDIVKELADSCAKYDMKMGIYLSPWDMHAPTYGTAAYNDYFSDQLTELVGGKYGKIFCMWFDGAGNKDKWDADFAYDFDRFYSIIRQYQPDCAISNCGPDVRWIGNEAGKVRESEWSVVPSGSADPDKIADMSQKNPEMAADMQKENYVDKDKGSREFLSLYNDYMFYPAEADVSIRKGWFYHWNQSPKKLSKLMDLYYKSVGANASLLLNVPVNKEGVIDNKDVEVLEEMGKVLAADKAAALEYTATVGNVDSMKANEGLSVITSEDRTTSYAMADDEYIFDLKLNAKSKVRMIDIREDLRESQRVEKYDIYAKVDGGWQLLSNATCIGNRRTVVISPKNAVETDTIRIVMRQSRNNPVIRSIMLYA